MDEITKAFLDKCSQTKESLDNSQQEVTGEIYTSPSITKLEIEEIFEAAGGSGTTTAAIRIGVSAISA